MMMGTFRIRIESKDSEVIDKFSSYFVNEVTEKGRGMVTASARVMSPTKVIVTMNYVGLGLSAFRKVVFPQIRKTAQKKDKDAKVELLGERKKAKPSLKEKLFGRSKKT